MRFSSNLLCASLMAVLACAPAIPASAQNLLSNPSFSANPAGTSGSVNSWTYVGNGSPGNSYIRNDGFSRTGNYYWLNDAPGPVPAIQQQVATASGTTYRFEGYYRTIVIGSGLGGFKVDVLDANTNGLIDTKTFNPAGNWAKFDYNVTVNTSAIRFKLSSQVANDNDFGVDDLSITAVNNAVVPEPASVALLLPSTLGLVGMLKLRRRKP